MVDLVPIKNERHEVKVNMSKTKARIMSERLLFFIFLKKTYEQEEINVHIKVVLFFIILKENMSKKN